jgi:D-3-phosphoglycerate dehydrogenase / 2-oxoglutarate reductase
MKKVLLATEKPFAKSAVEGIKKIVENGRAELILLENYTEKAQLLKAVEDVNAIIIRSDKIDKEVIGAAKNLEIVVRAGAGYDNVDTEAATANGVVVMNTPGQNSNAVGELAIGLMLFAARNQFDGSSGTELTGKTLGLYALGNTSKCLARAARGFNMDTYAYAPSKEDAYLEAEKVKRAATAQDLFSKCQYVSLHIPKKADTIGCITYELLSLMPKGATLVNTARKEVVDEAGLLKMFIERPDFKYVSDVAPDNIEDVAKVAGKRLFHTPKKMGAQTAEANMNAGFAAAKQIIGFFNTNDRTFQVNK